MVVLAIAIGIALWAVLQFVGSYLDERWNRWRTRRRAMSEWRTFYSNYDDGTMFISRSPDPDDLLVDGLPGEIATAIVDAHNAALAASAEPAGETHFDLAVVRLMAMSDYELSLAAAAIGSEQRRRCPPVAGPDAGEHRLTHGEKVQQYFDSLDPEAGDE